MSQSSSFKVLDHEDIEAGKVLIPSDRGRKKKKISPTVTGGRGKTFKYVK